MHRMCTTQCALCVETKLTGGYDPSAEGSPFVIDKPHTAYEWCVFRHDGPLEGEAGIKSNGDINGTVCYRSKIALKGKRQRKRRPQNECPRCGYKLN